MTEAEFSEDAVRPEYALSVSSTRVNPISKEPELYLPPASRLRRLLASLSTVALFLAFVIAFVATVMIYKVRLTDFPFPTIM